MRPPLWVTLQRFVPQRLIGKIVYRASRSRRRWLKTLLIERFAKHYAIDMSEAERTELSAYSTMQDFFTRALGPGARPVDSAPDSIVSPADGKLSAFGKLEGGRVIHAKGVDYSLAALVGEDPATLGAFADGAFATVYLAPHNYHRVHLPVDGRLVATRYIPGKRFAVNEPTLAHFGAVFTCNERVACWFEGPLGRTVVVLVGAFNVASLSVGWLGEISSGTGREWREAAPRPYAKGDEIGRFNLGSTVVVAFERGDIQWREGLEIGQTVRVGMALGRIPERALA